MTKILALGALGAGAFAIARLVKQRTAARELDNAFDFGDLDQPVVVSEEIVIVTEAGPYELDMELVPATEAAGQASPEPQAEEPRPGGDAGPR